MVELNAELQRRRGQAGKLQRHHDQLATELDRLRAELEALGSLDGAVPRGRGRGGRRGPGRPPGRRGRRRNKATLVDTLAAALKGRTMGVAEAAAAVKAAGYKSGARSFRIMVNTALIKGPFKRVGRGRYTAK